MLASAEITCLSLCGLELHGREFAASVAAIAEGLIGAEAAGAPAIGLAGFDFDGIGALLGNRGFGHGKFSLCVCEVIIADARQRLHALG